MLTWSSYTLSGSPQQCAFCRRPFPSIEGRREAFHSRAANGYFCDRLGDVGRRHGAQVVRLEKSWGETFDDQEARDFIKLAQTHLSCGQ